MFTFSERHLRKYKNSPKYSSPADEDDTYMTITDPDLPQIGQISPSSDPKEAEIHNLTERI